MEKHKQPHWSSILEDNSGGFSSSRFMALLWSVGVFIVWAFASVFLIIKSAGTATPVLTFIPIPGEVITIMLGFAGMKVVQRFGEKDGHSKIENINDPQSPSND